ncbi:MAG: hypothetical protein M1835_003091 [Candelina submexicana]|nr:MAG: hypothetical protein M1835_003091 [Candelina submexicana]
MKVTSSHLLTAFAACIFCSVAVARPIGDVDLHAPSEDDSSLYSAEIPPTDLSRRQDIIDQHAEEGDIFGPPYSEFSRRTDNPTSDVELENQEDYPVELPDFGLSRRIELPGIPKTPRPGEVPHTGSGSGAGAGAKAPGEQNVGGIEKSDTHFGADSSSGSKAADVKKQPGLNAEHQGFWEVGDGIMKDAPKPGAKDVTKYKNFKETYVVHSDRTGKKLHDSEMTYDPHDLDVPFKQMGLDINAGYRTMDIRSTAPGSKEPVLECDMSSTGPKTFIAEMKFKQNDLNPKEQQLPTWVISQQAMAGNDKFVPENLVQRDVINAGTQRTVVAARKELKLGSSDYLKLERNSPDPVVQKWFRVFLATDNVRPSALMLNKYPEYFGGAQIQSMHFWKKNDIISEQAEGTLPILMKIGKP